MLKDGYDVLTAIKNWSIVNTSAILVQNAEEVENAWDGIGTLAYGPKQAAEDFKKLFSNAEKNEKIMIVQQLSKKSAYPKTGGFCILQSSR